jgi:predicted membrane metal-binding protein
MKVEVHAPSTPLLLVSLALFFLALLCFAVVQGSPVAFWIAILAYCLMAIGTIVKT